MLELWDVIVIGAGAAGLAAAERLGHAGLTVLMLEARDRIGGRIHTQYDPVLGAPIEFGAEFIHGLPPEIWEPLQSHHVTIHEAEGDNWCVRQQQLTTCDFFEDVGKILEKMNAEHPDESFLSFLERCFPESARGPHEREVIEHAISYVSGFNAADPDCVGVHWLVKGGKAEEEIEGDRAFRCEHGYQDLLDIMRHEVEAAGVRIQMETVVSAIAWKTGHAEVAAQRLGAPCHFSAKAVLVTLPLGVLKAAEGEIGTVRFTPNLSSTKLEALNKLEMGNAARVTLRFRERFWEQIIPEGYDKSLADMHFLISQDEWIPTWWTRLPKKVPTLTGWAAFRRGERLSALACSQVGSRAVQSLAGLLHCPIRQLEDLLEATYFHDWEKDPFSRGAYSYGGVGADGAQEALGSPVENTLFFAGEATDTSGNNGTVHGAISSGKRAAQEIVQILR
jgi:monoamine oxidase